MGEQKVQDHLAVQDAKTVDASKLTALTPEVVSLSFHVIQCWSLIPFTGAVWRRQLRALFFDGVFFSFWACIESQGLQIHLNFIGAQTTPTGLSSRAFMLHMLFWGILISAWCVILVHRTFVCTVLFSWPSEENHFIPILSISELNVDKLIYRLPSEGTIELFCICLCLCCLLDWFLFDWCLKEDVCSLWKATLV